jgi:ATP-dependent DNA helicase RecG
MRSLFEIPDIKNLTIEEVLSAKEGQFYDRKSAEIKAKKIAEVLIAFANADGGLVAIGVYDGKVEGISAQGPTKINDFVQCKIDHCKPAIRAQERYLEVVNERGQKDHVLLIQVEPSRNSVHKTMDDKVFLRVGDESKELTHDQRLELEYDKGERLYEEQIISNCKIDDLDEEALKLYKVSLNFEGDDLLQPLYARGFINDTKSGPEISAAGVLLFTKNPARFFPAARIRFLRYEGSSEEVGVEMNIVKQEYIEGPLPMLIEKAKSVVKAQLREFTGLNPMNGKFTSVPEYPEFAWLEGIVNAVTHRAYNIQGDDIKIKMFDDRLEISSPGKFPNIVNRHNIKEVRYSRNPRIARALTEMGWVRELGEGVKRMFKEMNSFFLDDPEYKEGQSSVHLILKNNIVMRRVRKQERINTLISKEWKSLSNEEQTALEYIYSRGQITTRQLATLISRGTNYSKRILEGLFQKGILDLIRTSQNDPNQYYTFKSND